MVSLCLSMSLSFSVFVREVVTPNPVCHCEKFLQPMSEDAINTAVTSGYQLLPGTNTVSTSAAPHPGLALLSLHDTLLLSFSSGSYMVYNLLSRLFIFFPYETGRV